MEAKEKLNKIKKDFGDPFKESCFPKSLTIKEILDDFQEDKEISLAGRLVSKREHGKSGFAHISDHTGRLQIYAQLNTLGEGYKLYKELDIGDVIGVKGKLFKTRTGESTILADELKLLAKALRPLPEKFIEKVASPSPVPLPTKSPFALFAPLAEPLLVLKKAEA